MNIINMGAMKKESLVTVYASVYKSWLEEFPAYSLTHIEPFAKVKFVVLLSSQTQGQGLFGGFCHLLSRRDSFIPHSPSGYRRSFQILALCIFQNCQCAIENKYHILYILAVMLPFESNEIFLQKNLRSSLITTKS